MIAATDAFAQPPGNQFDCMTAGITRAGGWPSPRRMPGDFAEFGIEVVDPGMRLTRHATMGGRRLGKRRLAVNVQTHEELKANIWEIANRLRGPYRPPQYRLVMLPMVVLRRLDCVLEPTKDAVLKRRDELEAQEMPEPAMERLLGKAADPKRKHPLYNTSPYTFVSSPSSRR